MEANTKFEKRFGWQIEGTREDGSTYPVVVGYYPNREAANEQNNYDGARLVCCCPRELRKAHHSATASAREYTDHYHGWQEAD